MHFSALLAFAAATLLPSVTTGMPTQQQQQQQISRRADSICGTAPTGSSDDAPEALRTAEHITTATGCLELGQTVAGCESVEFGKASADATDPQCLLFDVAAAELPAPADGQTYVAYDVSCAGGY